MTTQPGDDTAAGKAGRGHLRASHADREQVISTLKAAYVQGMLAKDELDARVGQALASRTCADLAVLTADLPAMPAAVQPPRPARPQGGRPVLRPGPVMAATTALYAGVWAFTLLPPWPVDSEGEPSHPVMFLLLIASIIYPIVVAVGVTTMVANWKEKRSGGQSSRRPAAGAGGPASESLSSAGPDRRLPPAGPGHQHTAEAAPGRRSRTLLPGWRAPVSVPCVR